MMIDHLLTDPWQLSEPLVWLVVLLWLILVFLGGITRFLGGAFLILLLSVPVVAGVLGLGLLILCSRIGIL